MSLEQVGCGGGADAADDARGGGRGQSEVIGTILAVAVVVVLAAVIGQFVFGLDIIQNREQAVGPQVSFDTTVQDNGDLVIEHQSGNAVETDTLRVVGSESPTPFSDSSGFWDGVEPEWTASESITIPDSDLSPGETVRIVWEAPQNDDSAVILRHEYRP
jgi:flagellin-like protein